MKVFFFFLSFMNPNEVRYVKSFVRKSPTHHLRMMISQVILGVLSQLCILWRNIYFFIPEFKKTLRQSDYIMTHDYNVQMVRSHDVK